MRRKYGLRSVSLHASIGKSLLDSNRVLRIQKDFSTRAHRDYDPFSRSSSVTRLDMPKADEDIAVDIVVVDFDHLGSPQIPVS